MRYKVPKKWGDVVLDGDIPILDRRGTSVLTSAASRETVVRAAGERGGAAQNGGGKEEMRGKGRVSSPWDSSSSLDSCRAGCRWWSWAYCERQSLGFRKI